VLLMTGSSSSSNSQMAQMVHQSFPDWVYTVQPADLAQAVGAAAAAAPGDTGAGSVKFEAGVVLSEQSAVQMKDKVHCCVPPAPD